MITPHAIAAELAQNMHEVIPFLQSLARRSYELANSEGQQQAVMDALPDFGISAVAALTTYGAIYGALAALGQADGLTAPDLAAFQPQPDGTVLYVPPVVPEPEP